MKTKKIHSFLKTIITMFTMALGAVSTTYGATANLAVVASVSPDTTVNTGVIK